MGWCSVLRGLTLVSMAMYETHQEEDPSQFRNTLPDTRVIIDCSEVFIQHPSLLQSQVLINSNYKYHKTFKVIVGSSPGEVVTLCQIYGEEGHTIMK